MRQGEIWLLEQADAKARPAVVITRDSAIDRLRRVVVAPVTTTVRHIPTELPVGQADGLAREGVASMDNLVTVGRGELTRLLGRLAPGRWHEVGAAVRAAIDC
ncbi:MAG TPA: type II toxin-antitoxin system PemK/MazF family toxin [Ilumatobacter sp.]|nr:type II toxin-antitoxin system PemK/MazF family toxin [Ilumatobacter sp.]